VPRIGEEVAIPIVLIDEESREILQRVVDKTSMLVNLNIKVRVKFISWSESRSTSRIRAKVNSKVRKEPSIKVR
jgi:hypothetical protein